MDLNKLRTFTVVAECQNISKAAEMLYRTQPAVSNQIRDLEEELKLTLFERKNSRVYLTPEGQALFEKAKSHIADLEDSVIRLKKEKKQAKGTIRIAMERDTVSFLLPQVLRKFREEFPRVNFELIASSFGEIDDLLLSNRVDFAFTVLYEKKDFFETSPFLTFKRDMVAAKSLVKNTGPIDKVEDLLKLGFVGYASKMGDLRFWLKKNGYSKLISKFEKHLLLNVAYDAYTLNEMIIAGLGAGLSVDAMINQRKNASLVRLFPQTEPVYVTVDLAYKKVRNESYIQQEFRKHIIVSSMICNQV